MSEVPVAVPEMVTREQYLSAIEPLMALLNLKAGQVFEPIVIDHHEISLSVVAVKQPIAYADERPASWKAPVDPQATGRAELSVNLRVKIEPS